MVARSMRTPKRRDRAAKKGQKRPAKTQEPAELEDRVGEALRQLCIAADRSSAALNSSEIPPPERADSAAGFRAAMLAAEGRLTAPALLPLPAEEVGEILRIVATLCLESNEVRGNGDRVNALSSALGRRTRKKLRRVLEEVSLDEVLGVDFASWRTDVRALADWSLHRDALRVRKAPVGVRLAPDQELDDIVADLRSLAVVVFEFPSFTEGRPYSRARLLRERHGYGGEIRALGDVARDRLAFMERCGFNAFELRGGRLVDVGDLAERGEITHVYQSTARRTAA